MILPVIKRKMYFLKIKRINFGKNFCINKKKKNQYSFHGIILNRSTNFPRIFNVTFTNKINEYTITDYKRTNLRYVKLTIKIFLKR